MFISIVIPVYKDLERLRKCIDAIANQTFERSDFEIIVVNNDSFEELPSLQTRKLDLKVLECKKEGSYAARNTGARIAKGDYIAFVDSDCVPDKNWLATIKSVSENDPEADLIAGNVILYPKVKDKPNTFEMYDMILGIDQKSYAKKKKSVTANLVVKNSTFRELCGFDESNFSGGDHEFCSRANESGYKFIYVPESIVMHPARDCMSQISGKAERRIGGRIGKNKKKGSKAILITLSPPVVRLTKVMRSKKFALREKLQVIKIILLIKKIQIEELYKVVVLNKKSVR
ncbi:glycosyltransferase family 2 protein [Halomonas sp. PR-M31]|uniref:glycosyltransferase family 2 protein n=1 Tax=Halomonas sp. PR-M31 TaxID=1471202 RepID=UPI00065144B1|nr:glycosyltransferase family A protein [Halomonas sp. PR-M31]